MTSIRHCIAQVLVLTGFVLTGCSKSRQITAPGPAHDGVPSSSVTAVRDEPSRVAALQGHRFVPRSENPYFPLVPGTTFRYRARTPDGIETEVVAVTDETERIQGVNTIVIKDVVRLDGEVIERTTDWYAMDELGNVWYFGEESRSIDPETGEVGTEGSWKAGRDGAEAGIIMEAHPGVGDVYSEENAPGVAEDQARVVGLDGTAKVPEDRFADCLETENTSPLDPGSIEHKYYAPGVGLVLEVDADSSRNELVSVTRSGSDDGDESSSGDEGGRSRKEEGGDRSRIGAD